MIRPPGPMELVVILVIVLIIFGAGRLPQVAGALGKGIRQFRREKEGLDDDVRVESTKASTEASETARAKSDDK